MLKILAFEGIDGSGKTTISKRLASELDCQYEAEPTPVFQDLLDPTYGPQDRYLRLLAYLTDRQLHLHRLHAFGGKQKVIVMDRFLASTLAYQGAGDGFSHAMLLELTAECLIKHRVHLIASFWLDADLETARGRVEARGEPFDSQYLRRVHGGYEREHAAGRVSRVDANRSLAEVYADCLALAQFHLGRA